MLVAESQPLEKLVFYLARDMPNIGIRNKKKRVRSFISVCKRATELTSDRNDADASGIELLILFVENNKNFRKATETSIFNLERIEVSNLGVVGSGYANAMCKRYGIRAYFRFMVPDGLEESALG